MVSNVHITNYISINNTLSFDHIMTMAKINVESEVNNQNQPTQIALEHHE